MEINILKSTKNYSEMIRIEEAALDVMKWEAKGTFPDECCGFMLGQEDPSGNKTVVEILPVDNVKPGDRRRRFEIAPLDYLRAERHASETGQLLLGVYHSHPNHPAVPSAHDLAAAQPYFSYVILSVNQNEEPTLRSWVLNDGGRFEEEKLGINSINV
jgi:proteasome lid subunit RPN8/RPN11